MTENQKGQRVLSAGRAGSKGDDGIEGKGLLPCPWCGEDDFDLVGLKSHLDQGDCKFYNETIDLPRRKF